MDKNLPQTVEAIWDFLRPATVNLVTIIAIIWLLAPRAIHAVRFRLRRSYAKGVLRSLRPGGNDPLGLTKLAPAATLFVIFFALVVARDVARGVGKAIPPTLLWVSPNRYVALARPERLLAVWRHYDKAELEDLPAIVEDIWRDQRANSGYAYWEERKGLASEIADRTKFYLLLAIACVAYSIARRKHHRRALRRFPFVAVVLMVIYGVSVAYALHCEAGLIEGQVSEADRWLVTHPTQSIASDTLQERRAGDLASRSRNHGAWWRLGMPSWSW